jgi:hypothetical protein
LDQRERERLLQGTAERDFYRGLQNNDQLHGLSSWVNKPSDIKWLGDVAFNTQNGNAYGVFVRKPGVKSDRFEDLRLGGRTKIQCKVNKVNLTLKPTMWAQGEER